MNVPIWLIGLTLLTFVVMGVMLWTLQRRSRPHFRLTHFDGKEELMRSISGITFATGLDGNAVRLVHNGRFFDELAADLEQARSSISFETFLAKEGEVTRRLATILTKKAQEGVEVRLMLDGVGGRHFGDAQLREMREAGCQVEAFHPVQFSNLGKINNRTHRKMVIVDGRIGYVGGHCLVDSWLGEAQDKKHFRDVSARVEGPVVAQLQSAFIDNWMTETGEVPGGEGIFPILEAAGEKLAHVVFVSPAGIPSTMKLLHYAAIQAAKRRLVVQNPYFLPDRDARDALVAAVARGVDVRVMIPAAAASDSPIVQHASHHHYGTLLKGGVKLFEYQRTLLHQKVLIVDGLWASVGSSNFDDRSFEINDEVALVVYDKAFARELEEGFEADMLHALPQSLEQWNRRSLLHRLRDGASFLFSDQL